MPKFKYDFKLKVVKAYIAGEGGYEYLAKEYEVSKSNVLMWINTFNNLGPKGLKQATSNKKYSFEFKLNIVQLYLQGNISYTDLANQFEMNNPSLIAAWVIKYRKEGPDSLKSKQGRPWKMKKTSEDSKVHNTKIDSLDESERNKALQEQIIDLQIEIAFLKKKIELREREKTQKKKLQERFTKSERN